MNKLIAILLALFAAIAASGCAESHSPYNSPDQQRSHADKAQGGMPSAPNK